MPTEREIEAAKKAIVEFTFVPHELPLDDELDSKYREAAVLALTAAEQTHVSTEARLTDAIWEYGEHRKSCRIESGKECDCGFFEVIKSLKDYDEPA